MDVLFTFGMRGKSGRFDSVEVACFGLAVKVWIGEIKELNISGLFLHENKVEIALSHCI